MWTASVWMCVMTTCAFICFVDLSPTGRVRRSDFDSFEYLTNYGYLEAANLETGAMRSHAELDAAVRAFQGMSGLEQTGQLDERTLQKMQEPRCGIADMARGPQHFVIGSRKWEKTDITYSIKSFTSDISRGDTREAISQAFRMWSNHSPLTFREVSGAADIEISFVSRYHNDGYDFDGRGKILAHAFPPGGGRGGDAHFDDDESWTARSYDGTNLLFVATHEFGHSLGIDHSNVSGALMYPWYLGYKPNLTLFHDDISAIQALYAPRTDRTPSGRFPAPTGSGSTTTRPTTIPPVQSTRPRPPPDEVPNTCSSEVDSVTRIRGEIYAFRGMYFWRLDRRGRLIQSPILIRRFWASLPEDLTSVDAVYERPDSKIVFFKGNRFWMMSGTALAPGFPQSGRPLTDYVYGLDPGVTRVDAVFNWGLNHHGYIFSGYSYWKITKNGTRVESGYPKPTELWTGIPIPFDTVFTHADGRTYFLKGTNYWLFNDKTMEADPGYPKPLTLLWTHCPRSLTQSGLANSLSSSLGTLLISIPFGIIQNLFW